MQPLKKKKKQLLGSLCDHTENSPEAGKRISLKTVVAVSREGNKRPADRHRGRITFLCIFSHINQIGKMQKSGNTNLIRMWTENCYTLLGKVYNHMENYISQAN